MRKEAGRAEGSALGHVHKSIPRLGYDGAMNQIASQFIAGLISDRGGAPVSIVGDGQSLDVLLVAGNFFEGEDPRQIIRALQAAAGKGRVFYVPGPRDLKGKTIEEGVRDLRHAARGTRVRVLYRNAVDILGVRILGATLWPNLELMGRINLEESKKHLAGQEDFRSIVGASGKPLTAAEVRWEHDRDLKWLNTHLARDPSTPKLVLSHFAPSAKSLEKPLTIDSAGQGSSLEHLAKKSMAWAHGHVPYKVFYRLGNDAGRGLVMANPLLNGKSKEPALLHLCFSGWFVAPVPAEPASQEDTT